MKTNNGIDIEKIELLGGFIHKGSAGEYHIDGGDLDDAIFFLKPNRHNAYGYEDYKQVIVANPELNLPRQAFVIDECNPIESLMFDVCVN